MRISTTLVIGGGVSGLIYARERALAGDSVLVLEASDRVGGAVGSHVVGGVESNVGAEAFAIGQGHVRALAEDLGLGKQIVSPATGSSFVVGDERAYASPKNAVLGMPSRPFDADVRAALGFFGALRAWCERFVPASRATHSDVSVAEFVRVRYGKKVLERLVAPIIQGVHSADPEHFELRAALPSMLSAVREEGSAQRAVENMLVARGKRAGSGAAVYSLSPSMAELPKALARDIEQHGGTIMTNAPVTNIRVSDAGRTWIATTSTANEAITREFEASKLVLATGPEAARDLLKGASPEMSALIPSAPATPVRLATLALDNPELDSKPRGNGVLVSPDSRSITAKALTHATAKWDHIANAARAVKQGRHIVRLSYGRGRGDDVPPLEDFPWIAIDDAAAILGVEASALNVADWALTDFVGTMHQSGPGHTAALEHLEAKLAESSQRPTSPLPYLELTGAWRAGNGLEAITRFTRELAKKG